MSLLPETQFGISPFVGAGFCIQHSLDRRVRQTEDAQVVINVNVGAGEKRANSHNVFEQLEI